MLALKWFGLYVFYNFCRVHSNEKFAVYQVHNKVPWVESKNIICVSIIGSQSYRNSQILDINILNSSPIFQKQVLLNVTSIWHGNTFHNSGALWGKAIGNQGISLAHKGPVMRSFSVSLSLAWTNDGIAGDLRYPN